jgi:hypothetical protein
MSLAKLYYLNSNKQKAESLKQELKTKYEGIEEEWQAFIQSMSLIEQIENSETSTEVVEE